MAQTIPNNTEEIQQKIKNQEPLNKLLSSVPAEQTTPKTQAIRPPTKQTAQPTSALDYLSALTGTPPNAQAEAQAEKKLERQKKIENLTNAFKLVGQSYYANRGYHVPRPQPDYILANTQAELEKQKNAYAKDVAAYQARKAAIGSRLLSLQQTKDIEASREAQRAAEQQAANEFRAAELGLEGNRLGETAAYHKSLEDIAKQKIASKNYQLDQKGNAEIMYNGQWIPIPKSRLVATAVNIQQSRKALGLPLAENLKDIYGDLNVPANLNKIAWYIAQNYQYYHPVSGEGQFNYNTNTQQTKPQTKKSGWNAGQ